MAEGYCGVEWCKRQSQAGGRRDKVYAIARLGESCEGYGIWIQPYDEGTGRAGIGIAIPWYRCRGRAGESGCGFEALDHADEVGEGVGLHFFHDVAAVELDGDFAEAEFGGDLFVEVPGVDEPEDIEFAGGEAAIAGSDFVALAAGGLEAGVEVEGLLDGDHEFLGKEGLGEEFECAGLHDFADGGDVAVGGEEDDGDIDGAAVELLLEVDAGEAGEADIEEEAAVTVGLPGGEERLSGREAEGADGGGGEQVGEAFAHGGVVIDDEDGWRRWGRVVDCGGLENRCTERYRGFESLSLRNYGCSSVGRALVSKTRCRAFESLLPCKSCSFGQLFCFTESLW